MPDPAPRPAAARRLAVLWDWLGLALAAGGACWLLWRGAAQSDYHWQWYRVPAFLVAPDGSPGPLLAGLGVTALLTATAGIGALAAGTLAATLALSHSPAGRWLSRAYVEALRNTPLIVQLIFLYFVIGPAAGLDAFSCAVLGLALFEGAYVAEILRGGVLSVDAGQWDAARSLGMTRLAAYRHVILPQAVRRVLPPLASQSVSLVKDSSLASVIAIAELTLRGGEIVSRTFLSFEIWFTVAALYWLLTTALSALATRLERRLAHPA